jgi:hypothetical protein
MERTIALVLAAAVALSPVPVSAQAANFTLVNATDVDMTNLSVRRFGTSNWQPLTVAPVPVAKGARGAVQFKEDDCAFDLRATLPDGRTVIWPGVNLCQAKVVRLRQSARGELWVEYE